MKFIFETSPKSTTVYTKERFRKKQFIGNYLVPVGIILKAIENMFLDMGCDPKAVERAMSSLRYEPTKGEKVIDIKDGKKPGSYVLRELKWFFNIPYYKNIHTVENTTVKDILRVIVSSMPGYIAIDPSTNLPLNLDVADEDNRRTTATDKKKRSRPRNSSRRKLAVQKPRSKTKRR